MAFCGNCGASITQGNGFCGSCGKPVNSSAQPSTAAAVPTQQSNSGAAGWAPVATQQVAAPAAAQRPDAMSWSAVSNEKPQNGGWNSVPAQPAVAATPNPAQGWSSAPVPPSVATAPAISSPAGLGLTPNVAGALAYSLGIITGILFLVLEPYRRDRLVRFHAFQAIFYFVFAIAFSIAWNIMVTTLAGFSGWVFVVSFPLRMIIRLAMFCLWLYLMYQAYNNREFRIPILGAIASKQAQS
ncbi:DUF4870 domain-containing protein [Occallatibacter savannae]|uniref:DUF4870 domain-containing protein n=1 Tax=Occallatibacter savannae TaxID=1002691 RepID=UPI00194E5958|nr:hypothetical protein [Occallatibacter savannae]